MRQLRPQELTKHTDRLYRAAWALCGSPHDAEDLVQETFLRVLPRPRLIHGEDELYYLLRALRNTFFTTRREAARALHAREATITTRLFRARKQIAKRLLDESPAPAEQQSADGRAGSAA